MHDIKIVKLDIRIPYEIAGLAAILDSITESDIIVAGGCISDSFIGIPYRDIDIFTYLDREFIPIMLHKLESIFNFRLQEGDSYYEYGIVNRVYNFYYKGIKCQLIFMNKNYNSKKLIKSFDITIRQFYFYKNECFATQQALDDINNKKIQVINMSTPSSTLARINDFKKRFGYEIDEQVIKNLKQEIKSRE